jgi:FAD/FMN-containing dehydrogenase
MDSGSGTFPDLAAWTGNANQSPPCQNIGAVNMRFPIDLQEYNIQAQRAVFDTFARVTSEIPQFNNSLFLFEGYSLQGVKAVPHESTAFPFRDGNLLVTPLIVYEPEEDAPLDSKAIAFGEELRQILFKASGETELHAYVNYAFGDEQPKNWYGYEPWRLKRLKALKKKYDPRGRFSFYAPIA